MSDNNFQIMLQAMLDKIKSIANIKKNIKTIESKLPKIKLQGTMDETATQKELNTKLKSIKPKIKVDADTTQAEKKIKKIGKQKTKATIAPTVDNSQVKSGLKQAQKEIKTLWGRFTSGIIGANLVRMAVQRVTQAIKDAISTVKELDTIKTDIQMAAGVSDSKINAMMQSYNRMAKELSSTTKEVGEAANSFVRMGESLQNTEELIKNAQMLSKIGMTSSQDAASYLISAMKGYKIAAEDSVSIVDKLTSVDTKAAISSAELAEAMSKTANLANSCGVSMNNLIGYIATVAETTQKSATVVGTSFQSLFSRMSNIKLNMPWDEETGESLSDVESTLEKLGIKLRENETTYRNFDDVLKEIAGRWKEFNELEQRAVAKALGGTQQRENTIVLIENLNRALELSEVAANSAGSALQRYEVYQDSLEAKTNELTAALESLSTNIVSEELYSGIIEATTGIVEFLDKTYLLKGTLVGIMAMGLSKIFVSMGTGFITAAKNASKLTAAMDLFKNGKSDDNLKKIGQACIGLSNNQLKLVLSTKDLTDKERLKILAGMGVEKQERRQTLTTLGFAAAEDKAKLSTLSLKDAWNSLKVAWATNPIGIVIAGITTVVSIASTIIFNYKQKLEETRQKAAELTEAYKQQQSSLNSQIKKYKELKETLDKGNLSVDEARSIKEQLLEIQNSLVESYGTEVSNIDLLNGKYREQLGLLDDLSKKKAADYVIEHEGDYKTAKRELEKVRTYQIGEVIAGVDDAKMELVNYLKSYDSELLDIGTMGTNPNAISISVKANAEEADKLMHQLAKDLQEWADKNDIDHEIIEPLQIGISKYAGKTMTDALKEHKTVYDEYMKAKILSDDTLRPLYQQSIQAVEAYNKALSSGEGVEAAKANLDSVQQSVKNATNTLEGSQDIFDNIYEAINKNTEAAYQLNQAFINDETVKGYAEQLRGLLDIDLKAINFEDNIESPGEKAFGALIDILGLSEDEIQKLIDKLVELGYVQGKVQDAPPKAPATFDITTYKDQIDDFQSKLKSLGDTLSSIRSSNFQDSDLTDLLQEFPELADKTDDLENAIVKLINNALQTLYNTLGENIPDSLKTSLQELADIASGTAKHLGDALSSIHDSWDILHDFKDTMDKGFGSNVTDSLLQSVRKLSGELETLVAGYYSGVVTAEQLYEALEEHYGNDLRNYSEALIKKNELNEDFYNAVGLASEKVTNQFMDDYDVDLKNCKNYNQAKLEIEQQTIGKMGGMWSKYYDVASQTYTQEMLDLRKQERSTSDDDDIVMVSIDGGVITKKQMLRERIQEIESQVNNYKAAMEALNSITYDGIRSNFEGIGSKLSANSSKSTKEFDWIEQAIENVEKEVKELDGVVNSSYSTFSQKNESLAKEISKVSEEIALQQKAYEEYMRKADSIGLSDDYKNLIRDGAINIENISDEDLQKKISDYQQWYEKAVDVSEAISGLNEQMKDLHVKGYELQVERLDDLLDSYSITEKQYLAEMESLYKKYYQNQVAFAQKAHEAKMALLEKEKSYLNSVANAASSLLDKEISKVQDNAKAQEEPYKAQIKEAEKQKKIYQNQIKAENKKIDAYNKEIDLINDRKKPLQDELDALEDKVRKEELALNLQKAQYDLAKAQNQRNKLVYKDGQLVYETDLTAIRDARKKVDDAKLEIQKYDIQKQIDALDDEIEKYNELIDAVNDHIDSINDQVDALDDEIDKYNDLIDQINDAADAQVDALERIRSKWQEVIDQQEEAKNLSLLIGEFGVDAITKILTGNDDDLLAQWKENYINTLADIDMESQGYIGDMTKRMAGLYDVDLSSLQDQFQNVKESVDDVTKAIGNTDIGAVPPHVDTGANSSSENLAESIDGLDTAADGSLPGVKSYMDDIGTSAMDAASEVSSVADAINNIPAKKDVTINVHTSGIGGSSQKMTLMGNAEPTGRAFADGSKGLAHDEKNALRSEYGQSEVTVYPDGKTELTTQPIMSDLPKGTVIYNEEQTEKIMNAKPQAVGNAHADGTDDEGWFTLSDGSRVRPLREGDKGWDMMKAGQAFIEKWKASGEEFISNAYFAGQKQLEQWTKEIINNTAVNNIINNNKNIQQPVVNQNITLNPELFMLHRLIDLAAPFPL